MMMMMNTKWKMNGTKKLEEELEEGAELGEEKEKEKETETTSEKEKRRTECALAAMHAGLDGSARRNDKVKPAERARTSILSHFQRRSKPPKVRRITVHEMNGNVKSSRRKSNSKERKVSVLNPMLYAGTGALLGSVASLSASEKTQRIMTKGESSDAIKEHTFLFENLVFEGGGNKGMAYVGALQHERPELMMAQLGINNIVQKLQKAFSIICKI